MRCMNEKHRLNESHKIHFDFLKWWMKSTTRTHTHTHTVENDAREKRRRRCWEEKKKVQALKKHRTKSSKNSSTKRVHTCKCGFICMCALRTHISLQWVKRMHTVPVAEWKCNNNATFAPVLYEKLTWNAETKRFQLHDSAFIFLYL